MPNYTLSYSAQLACRNLNTTIPEPPFLANSTATTCVVSNFLPSANILLSECCNTTGAGAHIVKPNANGIYVQTNLFTPVSTGGYEENGCTWRYCNVTGQGGIDAFGKCLNTTNTSTGPVQGKCFTGSAKVQLAVTNGGYGIKWRSEKKKDTVSAALLMALGVAGIIIGGT